MINKNPVISTTKFVVQSAKHVKINVEACRNAVNGFNEANYDTSSWSEHLLNPKLGKPHSADEVVNWIFTVDLLNFSFWSDVDDSDTGKAETNRFSVQYKDVLYTGYWALAAAINRAIDNGIAITDVETWKSQEFEQIFRKAFQSDTTEEAPLIEDRIRVLQEAASADQSIFDLIRQANKSALKLVELITGTFKSFDDSSIFKERRIFFNKRAQILVADIWAAFQGHGYGEFQDINKLTMFADYRVPQILHSLGCISYSQELTDHIMNLQPINHGDDMEVELRAASIQAVEEMMKWIKQKGLNPNANSVLIDFYLWDTAKEKQKNGDLNNAILCHRTRSIYY